MPTSPKALGGKGAIPVSKPTPKMVSYPCCSAPGRWALLAWQAHPRAGSTSSAGSRWTESHRSPRDPHRGWRHLASGSRRGRSVRGARPWNGCPDQGGSVPFSPLKSGTKSWARQGLLRRKCYPNSPGLRGVTMRLKRHFFKETWGEKKWRPAVRQCSARWWRGGASPQGQPWGGHRPWERARFSPASW